MRVEGDPNSFGADPVFASTAPLPSEIAALPEQSLEDKLDAMSKEFAVQQARPIIGALAAHIEDIFTKADNARTTVAQEMLEAM